MRQYLNILCALLLSQFSLVSCGSDTTKSPDPTIFKIVFAQSGCYGRCPSESITIDSTLSIKYYGVEFVDRIGYFQGSISQESWNDISRMCSNVKDTQTDSCAAAIDAQMIELHIYSKFGVQHFWGDWNCLPDSLVAICTQITKLAGNTLMSESSEFPIETHLQSPPPQINTEQFNEIKFVEPEYH